MERDPAAHRTVEQQQELVGDPTEAKDYVTIPVPLAPFALEGEGEIVNRLALVTVLQWHESGVRAPCHSDVSLGDFEQATKRRAGLPSEYSAAVYENAHIRTCKLRYRTSNHRQPLQDIRTAAADKRSSSPQAQPDGVDPAIASSTPQLTAARKSLTARPDHESDAASVFDEINQAMGGILMYYDTVTRNAGLRPFPAWAHSAVALPAHPTDYGHIKPHYVRAAATLHGHTAFSCVEYDSAAGQPLYGRLLPLLDAERPLDDGSYEPAEVAVLQRLTPQGLDQCMGCQLLGPPGLFRGVTVVPISKLRRAVHCVPSFEERDLWYLNKWAYLINEEQN
ncbi:unnamed protein product [Closterium sp. Naga37s-1]|nr:unnamed protein product [Closterium sp. Naga37s-1]